jgi:PAS domain S-box-containing protein
VRGRSDNIERAGLAAAVEQAGDGIVITGTDGKIQYVNPAFTAMTGYTGEEAVGQSPRLLKSGRHPAVFYEELWNTIRCGRIWHGELINRRKDGTFYHEEMRITPVLGVNGEIVSYIAIKQDVTKRREAEESRRFLAAIVESSDDAIISKTLDGTISTWNEAAEALYGYRADEAIGEPISLLLPADRQDEMSRILDCIRGEQRLSRFETVRITKDGRSLDVSLDVSPIKDAAGTIVGAATIARDISERRRADRAMRDTAERFRALFERSLDCLYIHDFDGNFLDANPAALKLVKWQIECD